MGSVIGLSARPVFIFGVLLCLAPSLQARAASFDEAVRDEATLTQLEAHAESAQPREQCFLYAELVHNFTELAGNQLANGQDESANTTLRKINTLAQKIHMSLARDPKRLKNTELLINHTTRRLADMLHLSSSNDDRVVLQSTLKRLDEVQSELLAQVFVH